MNFNSQIVYRIGNEITRLTGPFYKNENQGEILNKDYKIIIRTSPGDELNGKKYSTNIIFINNITISEKNYYIEQNPNISEFNTTMIVHVNFDNITKYLLIQRVFNNYYIVTGIIFLIIGIFLSFFGTFEMVALFTVNMIFGQLMSFIILEIIIGINKIWFEFLLLGIGILLGGFATFLCSKYDKIYKIILGITSGTIFGIYLTEIFIFPSSYYLIKAILLNNLLISISFFLFIVFVFKKYYKYLYSILGGYITVRGISIILFKFLRYRELQIILYLANSHEWEYFLHESKNELNWNLYYIYDILIAVFSIISMTYYGIKAEYYKNKLLQSENDEIKHADDVDDY